MLLKLPLTPLLLSIFAFFATSATASELWRCGSTFTNSPKDPTKCTQVRSSRVCGVNGNKVFAPYKAGYSDSSTEPKDCVLTVKETSPLVDYSLVNAIKEAEKNPPDSKEPAVKSKPPKARAKNSRRK